MDKYDIAFVKDSEYFFNYDYNDKDCIVTAFYYACAQQKFSFQANQINKKEHPSFGK